MTRTRCCFWLAFCCTYCALFARTTSARDLANPVVQKLSTGCKAVSWARSSGTLHCMHHITCAAAWAPGCRHHLPPALTASYPPAGAAGWEPTPRGWEKGRKGKTMHTGTTSDGCAVALMASCTRSLAFPCRQTSHCQGPPTAACFQALACGLHGSCLPGTRRQRPRRAVPTCLACTLRFSSSSSMTSRCSGGSASRRDQSQGRDGGGMEAGAHAGGSRKT